ncbi:MAG: ATP-binding cassette domain-containing protein [Byssovorax sp.]
MSVGNAVRRAITDILARRGHGSSAPAETVASLVVLLREVERGVDEGLLAGLRALANLAPLAVALVLLSSRLALLALLALVPFALLLSLLRRRLLRGHARALRLAEELHTAVDELVRHLDLFRTYGAASAVQQALVAAGEQAGQVAARADAGRAALSGANEALAAGALLGAVLLVERAGVPLGSGSLVAFAAVFFLMYRPLRDLGDARASLDRGATALEALDRATVELAEPEAPAPRNAPRPFSPARLDVRALSVVHGDAATEPTSFHLDPGEVVALVGPTGSGKTSLIRALLGLEAKVLGEVRYGDRSLDGAGVGPAERPFAWVPQEPAIVRGTLAENITLGAPEAPDSPAVSPEALLAELGARTLLDRGAGAPLQAGGRELSGGERQWIAIARALAGGQPVLLLDEPTSGLDPASQQKVLAALAALKGKRAMLLVTHRPEPLALADRVVRLGEHEPSA